MAEKFKIPSWMLEDEPPRKKKKVVKKKVVKKKVVKKKVVKKKVVKKPVPAVKVFDYRKKRIDEMSGF